MKLINKKRSNKMEQTKKKLAVTKMKYVICRSNMGVHAGELNEKESTDSVADISIVTTINSQQPQKYQQQTYQDYVQRYYL